MLALLKWILKRFWFPILVFVLAQLAKKYPWAAKTHATVTKYSQPIQTVASKGRKKGSATF